MKPAPLAARVTGGLLFLATIVAAAPSAQADEIVTTSAMSIALGGTNMIWSSYQGCPDEIPPVCMVRSLPSTAPEGNSFRAILVNATGWRDDDLRSNVAADAEAAYWADVGGDIVRRQDHSSGSIVISTKEDPATAGQVAVDDQYVYWTENDIGSGRLFRAPKSGGARELLYENADAPLEKLQADGTGGVLFLSTNPVSFLCCADQLHRVAPMGPGLFSVDIVDTQFIESYAVESDTVYFVTRLPPDGPGEVHSAPLSDLENDVVLFELEDEGDPHWPAMAATSQAVYVQEYRTGGPIVRIPLDGAEPEMITTDLPEVGQMVVDDEHLFALAGEKVYRFDLDAEARTLDLVNDRLEVVQVLQDLDHTIELAAGKRTFVRAFARIGDSSEGLTELQVWPAVLLHGSRDGDALPGSPLAPLLPGPLHAADGIDRTTSDNTLLFELPESWTHGAVHLQTVVNPRFTSAETLYENNLADRDVIFKPVRGICLDVLPVSTTAGTSVVHADEVPGHFTRAKSMFPTDRFFGLYRGGTPRTIPLVGDPYNMNDNSHTDLLMMNLGAEFMFASPPVECGDAVPIRAAIVKSSTRFGKSHGSEGVIYALRSFDADFPENTPEGGVKGLAHEVGHQMGIHHVNCGGPGWPFYTLPYEDQCSIAHDNNTIGFDVIARKPIVPYNADGDPIVSDFMSYSNIPLWASPAIYGDILNNLANGASDPVTGEGAPSGTTNALIVGYVPQVGAGFMGHAYRAQGATLAEAAAKIARLTQPSAEYGFRIYDDAGTLLDEVPLNAVTNTDEGDGQTLQFYHFFSDPVVASIEVVHNTTGTVMASRAAGLAAPAITVTSPAAGQSIGDDMTVTWTGSDADGDALAYLVRYSNDGGTTWKTLGADRVGGGMSVDMSRMPGGANALLEVTASDGLHSTTTVVGPFTVATHAPEVSILTEQEVPVGASSVTSFRQSEPAVLQAFGYDAEDGDLSGSAFVWQLDGPVSHTASGDAIRLWDLPPGTYAVTLNAIDSDGELSTAETQLEIMPKLVLDAKGPVLDGACDDAAYALDSDALRLRDADGSFAEVRMVRAYGDLYACFNGLTSSTAAESATLRVDVDGNGGPSPAAGDLAFRVSSDGLVQTGTLAADGSVVAHASPIGLTAGVRFGAQGWRVEMRIEGDLLGPWDRMVRVHASHDRAGAPAAWPIGSAAATPDTWGEVRLGTGTALAVVTPTDVAGNEGAAIPLTATQIKPYSSDLSVTWTVDAGAPCAIADPSAVTTTISCADDGLFVATLTVDNGVWIASDSTRVAVTNVAPVLGAVTDLVSPLVVGSTAEIGVPFTDGGAADTHACALDWGDGTLAHLAGITTPCQSSHVYPLPGLFTVQLSVVDDDGGVGAIAPREVIVYDPNAGFVTGAGALTSPAGALVAQAALAGSAKFELMAQYKQSGATPHGGLRFKIASAKFDFRSSALEWLVLQGHKAYVTGSGTVDGVGEYGFLMAIIDGAVAGGGGVDRLRVKIWEQSTDAVVYDNQPGGASTASPTQAISHGSLVIHD